MKKMVFFYRHIFIDGQWRAIEIMFSVYEEGIGPCDKDSL